MKCIGIDIGTFSIKIAEIDTVTKGFEITRIQEFPLSQDPSRDRKIEIIDLLRNIFPMHDASNTKFIFGMRQNHVSSRVRMFPFRERHKILKSLAFELEDDLPFSQQDAIFEAKIVKYVGTQAEVFALASPKERIIELLSLASDGGIDPDIISAEGIAIANLLEPFLAPPPEEPAQDTPLPELKPAKLLLNMGHDHSVLIVLADGTLKLIRHIDWGGRHLAEALSKKYSLLYLEALKDLKNKSFLLVNNEGATKEQVMLSDTLKTAFEPLIQELRLSLLETQSDFQLEFKDIYISGGLANLKGLQPFLTQKLNIATNYFPPMPLFPVSEMSAGVAIGLAIEGLRRPKNPAVQFLKNEFVKQSQRLNVFWDRWRHTAKIATATFIFLLIYSYFKDDFANSAVDEAQTLLKNQAAAIANLKGNKASMKAIKDFIKTKQQEEKDQQLAEKIQDLIPAMDILNRLSGSIPSRRNLSLEVQRCNISGEFLEVQGLVNTIKELELFKNSLSALATDGKVESFQTKPFSGRKNFSFRLRIHRMKGG